MKFEFSAGGIVFKKENGIRWVLLCRHSQHHGWVFPKGLIGDNIANESKEQTAIREVKEETGANAVIIKDLKPVAYWYICVDASPADQTQQESCTDSTPKANAKLRRAKKWHSASPANQTQHEPCTDSTPKANAKLRRDKIKKTVYYYLMEYSGGDITDHDHEMDAVEWLPEAKVEERLSYKSDKKAWHEAMSQIENLLL